MPRESCFCFFSHSGCFSRRGIFLRFSLLFIKPFFITFFSHIIFNFFRFFYWVFPAFPFFPDISPSCGNSPSCNNSFSCGNATLKFILSKPVFFFYCLRLEHTFSTCLLVSSAVFSHRMCSLTSYMVIT